MSRGFHIFSGSWNFHSLFTYFWILKFSTCVHVFTGSWNFNRRLTYFLDLEISIVFHDFAGPRNLFIVFLKRFYGSSNFHRRFTYFLHIQIFNGISLRSEEDTPRSNGHRTKTSIMSKFYNIFKIDYFAEKHFPDVGPGRAIPSEISRNLIFWLFTFVEHGPNMLQFYCLGNLKIWICWYSAHFFPA